MTNDIVYSKTFDFPPMPDHLVKQALAIVQDQSNSYIFHNAGSFDLVYRKSRSITQDQSESCIFPANAPLLKDATGVDLPVLVYNAYWVSPDIFDWVASNIPVQLPSNIEDRKIAIQTFRPMNQLTSYAPHTDGPRGQYVLNYQIDTGGDNALTKWYHEAGHSLVREPGLCLPSFQNLKEVHSEQIAQGTWWCLHSRILHSVVNVERPRISLSIGLDSSP